MAKKRRRIDARKALNRTRDKLSQWEAKAERAARDLERYRRPDLVAKAARRGRAAEKKLREFERREKQLTRRVAKVEEREREAAKKPKAPGVYVYHPKVTYMARRNHEAVVEVSFRWKDGGQRSAEEVQNALHDLVKQKERPDLIIEAVHYGRLGANVKGQRRDLRAFLGVVLSGNLETIGEEIRK